MSKEQVGRPIPRLESETKVTGTTEYIHNFALSGMLHGKLVRSVHPHARIVSIDSRDALELPGVRHVVTSDDVRRVTAIDHIGPAFDDQPVLAIDKVRFVGEPVACVIADDPDTAARGVELVDVRYEELPAVFDEVEACEPDAPIVHDHIRASASFADLKALGDREGTNVALEYTLRHGDAERGLATAHRVFDHTFHIHPTVHAAMEPHVSVGEVGGDGVITVHSATQNPSVVQVILARLFGVPENRIRVRTAFLGGGFGAKLYMKLEPLAAVCAVLAGRPVRIALSMDESMVTLTRHGATLRLRTGVDTEARIVARACEVVWNTGAYADIGPRITQKSGSTAAGPYDIEDVSIDSRCVYTNLPPAGALRGFGIPQVTWAYESQADIIAREMDVDPIDFRERNLLRNGRPHATGTILRGAGTEQVLGELRRAMNWDEPLDRGEGPVRRGRGVAFGIKACITPSTSVGLVSLAGDASCRIYCGTVDMGQGSDTGYAQIVGEILGLRAEDIEVIHPDTRVTPYDMGTLGSRSLYHMGNALQQAADQIRDQLLDIAAAQLGTGRGDLELTDGAVVTRDGDRVPMREVVTRHFGMQAGNLIGQGTYTPSYTKPDRETGQSDDITAFWMVGGTGVEVTVDTDTGALDIEKLVVVGDAGRAINPDIVRTQLSGAAIMQLGMSRSEELRFEDGQLTNTGLAYYKVPGMLDVPTLLESVPVEFPLEGDAPFGAKGIGETGSFAVGPALANAIEDAVGVRIVELPLTDERIWNALRSARTTSARS